MNAQVTSFTSSATYGLVIDEIAGQATDCGCKDRIYRKQYKPSCKHMNEFNAEVQKAETFLGLMKQYNGSPAVSPSDETIDEMARYYEAEETARQTARCYWEMQNDPRFQ